MGIPCWRVDLNAVSMVELFEWCLREHAVDRMLLVLRVDRSRGRWALDKPGISKRFEHLLGPHIRECFLASGWPGTELFRQPSLVYVLTFNESVKDLLVQVEPNLKKWNSYEAGLPEDLCLFRIGEPHPIFISVTHERLAWLLTNKRPTLQGVSLERVVDSEKLRQEPMAFPGKCFCRPWRGKLQAVDRRLLLKRK